MFATTATGRRDMAQESTITPSTKIPLGMAWTFLGVMVGGVAMATAVHVEVGHQGVAIQEMRHEIKDMHELMLSIDRRVHDLEMGVVAKK